jgi:hypothetical protein
MSVRQPAFLMHLGDTMGPFAERLCTHFVHNGRLPFSHLLQHMISEVGEACAEHLEAQCAALVLQLLSARLLEQVRLSQSAIGDQCQAACPASLICWTYSVGVASNKSNHSWGCLPPALCGVCSRIDLDELHVVGCGAGVQVALMPSTEKPVIAGVSSKKCAA